MNLWVRPFGVLAALHVAVAATTTHVLVVTIVEHVDAEGHRIHILVHEVFSDAR